MPNLTPNYSLFLPLVDDPTDQDLWGGYLNDNFSSLDTLLASLTPSGTYGQTACASAPTGWLLCYGQAISRTTYAALFTAIGTTYGTGDGSTTFNLPDARGRVLAGLDNMGGTAASRLTVAGSGTPSTTLGGVGGNELLQTHLHANTAAQAAHTHTVTAAISAQNQSLAAGESGGSGTINNSGLTTSSQTPAITVTNVNAGGGGAQNVQPVLMSNIMIKT